MNKLDKYYIKINGQWLHRTPLKIIINPILRSIQFWTNRKLVIASNTVIKNGSPRFLNYCLKRVLHEEDKK